MLPQQVICQRLRITRQGSIRHFQIRLPRHAQGVIGVEYGVRMISALVGPGQPADFVQSLTFIPSRVIGELKLHHVGSSGLFFSTQVMEQDSHLSYGDYSKTAGFVPQSWTHSAKREPLSVHIEREATILFGIYKDIVGEIAGQHLTYEILIHLWIQTKQG